MTWGRMAGRLIEEYVLGSMELLAPAAKRPMRIRDKNIGRMAARSSTTFWASRRSLLEKLDAKATSKLEGRARLEFTLEQTTRYEFALLAADYGLRKRRLRRFSPVDLRAGIETSNSATRISPSPDLGLSKANTPDFVVLKPDLAVGEIKTGIKLEPYHLHTIAGYALAYESQHAVDVNFGVVYFFETHVSQMRLNHTYFFVIDDFLRRKFLDIRDHVYALLMEDGPPPLADYEKDCKYCKFRKACYPPVNG
jgi:CRISPR/Cas system-associated exonuclease Cas4 (RecB family)